VIQLLVGVSLPNCDLHACRRTAGLWQTLGSGELLLGSQQSPTGAAANIVSWCRCRAGGAQVVFGDSIDRSCLPPISVPIPPAIFSSSQPINQSSLTLPPYSTGPSLRAFVHGSRADQVQAYMCSGFQNFALDFKERFDPSPWPTIDPVFVLTGRRTYSRRGKVLSMLLLCSFRSLFVPLVNPPPTLRFPSLSTCDVSWIHDALYRVAVDWLQINAKIVRSTLYVQFLESWPSVRRFRSVPMNSRRSSPTNGQQM
jgi:hypothetical protein